MWSVAVWKKQEEVCSCELESGEVRTYFLASVEFLGADLGKESSIRFHTHMSISPNVPLPCHAFCTDSAVFLPPGTKLAGSAAEQ